MSVTVFVQPFVRAYNKNTRAHITGLLGRESTDDRWVAINKGPVMQKVYPCHDVIVMSTGSEIETVLISRQFRSQSINIPALKNISSFGKSFVSLQHGRVRLPITKNR